MSDNAEDRVLVQAMRDSMLTVLHELGMEQKLAINIATVFAEQGVRVERIGGVAEWLAVLYILDGARPPDSSTESQQAIAVMRQAAVAMLMHKLGVTLDPRIMTGVRFAVARDWSGLSSHLHELRAMAKGE